MNYSIEQSLKFQVKEGTQQLITEDKTFDYEDDFDERNQPTYLLEPGDTKEVDLGTITTIEYLLITTDSLINIKLGEDTYWETPVIPVSSVFLIAGADIDYVSITNPSASANAKVEVRIYGA